MRYILATQMALWLIACGGVNSGELTGQSLAPAAGIPTATAGGNQSITYPTNFIVLSGGGEDSDGEIVSYRWSQISGPNAARFDSSLSPSTRITDLIPGTYVFQLLVKDDRNFGGSDTVVVTVHPEPANIPPRAVAGVSQSIALPKNSVMLSGIGTDTDGTIVAYEWSQISGPNTARFNHPNSPETGATGLVEGNYVIRLMVRDNRDAVATDSLIITVKAAPAKVAPVADAGPNRSLTLPGNSIVLNGSGSDVDGTVVSYVWTQVSGPTAAQLTNSASAALSAAQLVEGTYEFQLAVTDDHGLTGIDTATVTVNPATNVAPVANAGSPQIITLPTSSLVINGSGSDQDGTIASYHWIQVSGPSAAMLTNSDSARVTASALRDGIYTFRLTVTDNSGFSDADTTTITVNRAPNVAPTVSAGPDRTITLPVNSISLTGSASDSDGSIISYLWAQASGPAPATLAGEATASLNLTWLVAGSYIFSLTVIDNEGVQAVSTVTVTVLPEVANVPPAVSAGANQILVLPATGLVINGSAADSDGAVVAYEWTQVSGPTTATLVNSITASVSVSGLTLGTYVFKLVATDNRGASSADTVSVLVVESPNDAPLVTAGADRIISLPTSVITISAATSDADGVVVSYQWTQESGPTQALLSGQRTGTLRAATLDAGTYVFKIVVTDDDGATAEDSVMVTVNP